MFEAIKQWLVDRVGAYRDLPHYLRDVKKAGTEIAYGESLIAVTTSFLAEQAYKEIKDDGHPVWVLSGRDIVELLGANGITTVADVADWLDRTVRPSITS